MAPQNSIEKSICFCAASADALNAKAFRLDHRLFLFAYYDPEPYRVSMDNRSLFFTAVRNIYRLHKDCSPFLRQLLRTSKSILINNQNIIKQHFDDLWVGVSAFRALSCHNCSMELLLNSEQYSDACDWAREELNRPVYDLELLTAKDWGQLTESLCSQAEQFIMDIDRALSALRTTADTVRKNNAIDNWISKMSESYEKHTEYLLNALAEMYQYYTVQWKVSVGNPNSSIREQTTIWVEDILGVKGKNYVKWLNHTKIEDLLTNWPANWAKWNSCTDVECDTPPLPASDFFKMLCYDVYCYCAKCNSIYDDTITF